MEWKRKEGNKCQANGAKPRALFISAQSNAMSLSKRGEGRLWKLIAIMYNLVHRCFHFPVPVGWTC
jgi:hypothetical protein